MEDLKVLTECAECTWDYIDRLRMALASTCKERDELKKRLSAYEDSGLEPEEIKELRELCTDEVAELARTLYKAMESGKLDHLRDILQADQDGRIPPCKRGDVVYCIRHNPCIGYYVKTLTVCTVTIWGPGRFSVFTTKEDELGKTVFLTREEAEAALAQKGGTNEDSGSL